jgi:hypothetical protein
MSKNKRAARGRRAEQTAVSVPATPLPTARASSSSSRRTSPEEFAEEYAYVRQDLRNILILAVVMFSVMIGLNLLLH